jgi:hypothetical protein
MGSPGFYYDPWMQRVPDTTQLDDFNDLDVEPIAPLGAPTPAPATPAPPPTAPSPSPSPVSARSGFDPNRTGWSMLGRAGMDYLRNSGSQLARTFRGEPGAGGVLGAAFRASRPETIVGAAASMFTSPTARAAAGLASTGGRFVPPSAAAPAQAPANPNLPQPQAVSGANPKPAEVSADPNAAMRQEGIDSVIDEILTRSGEVDAQRQGVANAQRAEATRKTLRAFRLPSGRTVFTNDPDSYGGATSVAYHTAARSERGGDVAASSGPRNLEPERGEFGARYFPPVDSNTESMRRLVRNSAMARARSSSTPSFTNADIPDDAGTVSQMSGSPQRQRELQLEDAQGLIALNNAKRDYAVSAMSPVEQERLKNPDVVSSQYRVETFLPQINQATSDAAMKIQMVSTPGRPEYIQDLRARTEAIRMIQADRDAKVQALQSLMATVSGTTIPRQF